MTAPLPSRSFSRTSHPPPPSGALPKLPLGASGSDLSQGLMWHPAAQLLVWSQQHAPPPLPFPQPPLASQLLLQPSQQLLYAAPSTCLASALHARGSGQDPAAWPGQADAGLGGAPSMHHCAAPDPLLGSYPPRPLQGAGSSGNLLLDDMVRCGQRHFVLEALGCLSHQARGMR